MNVEQIRTHLKYYTGMPVLDQAQDDIEYLINRIERYEKALERISGSTMSQYASLNHMASEFIRVAEEALKEE